MFVSSACTVDFEIPNFCAAARTVALFSMMYTAKSHARCSMSVLKHTTPISYMVYVYDSFSRAMRVHSAPEPSKAREGLVFPADSWYNQRQKS